MTTLHFKRITAQILQVVHITVPWLERVKNVYFYIISHDCTNYFRTWR